MSDFVPTKLLDRVLNGIRLGGYPPDIIENAVNAASNDEIFEWLDSPYSTEWIRRAAKRRNLHTGTDIVFEAMCDHLERVTKQED